MNVNIPEVTFEKQLNIIIYNTYCTRTCIKITQSCENLKTENPLNLKKHLKNRKLKRNSIGNKIDKKISKLFINFLLY